MLEPHSFQEWKEWGGIEERRRFLVWCRGSILRKKRDFTATFARLLAAYTSARFQKKLQAIARHRDVSGIPWRAVHCWGFLKNLKHLESRWSRCVILVYFCSSNYIVIVVILKNSHNIGSLPICWLVLFFQTLGGNKELEEVERAVFTDQLSKLPWRATAKAMWQSFHVMFFTHVSDGDFITFVNLNNFCWGLCSASHRWRSSPGLSHGAVEMWLWNFDLSAITFHDFSCPISAISRYGFAADEQGIEEMERSLQLLEEDGDVYAPRQYRQWCRLIDVSTVENIVRESLHHQISLQKYYCTLLCYRSRSLALITLIILNSQSVWSEHKVNKVAIEEALFGPFEDVGHFGVVGIMLADVHAAHVDFHQASLRRIWS